MKAPRLTVSISLALALWVGSCGGPQQDLEPTAPIIVVGIDGASWPAEQVNGIVVSDRATRPLENTVWPPEFDATFNPIAARESQRQTADSHSAIARQDRVTAEVAIELASQDFDLLLAYFRNVDAESHPNWKYFRPAEFEAVDPERLTADLARVTYQTGEPAFRIREPKRDEREKRADLTVVVRQSGVAAELLEELRASGTWTD